MPGANVRIAVVEDNGQIEAFVPYEMGDGGVAAAVGGIHTGVDGIVSSGAPLDMRAVIKKSGLRGWRFSRTPAEQKDLDPYRYQGQYHCRSVSCVDLSQGHEQYLSSLDVSAKKRVTRTESYRRALQRKTGCVELEWASPKPEYFDQLIEWKSAQYENVHSWSGRPLSVMRDLAFSDEDDCRGLLGVLFAGDEAAAVTLCLAGPSVIALWTLAYNPEFGRFSVGTMQLLDLFSGAAQRGIKLVDFGADFKQTTNTYKDRFRNATYEVSGGGVWASRLGAAGRSLYRRAKYRD